MILKYRLPRNARFVNVIIIHSFFVSFSCLPRHVKVVRFRFYLCVTTRLCTAFSPVVITIDNAHLSSLIYSYVSFAWSLAPWMLNWFAFNSVRRRLGQRKYKKSNEKKKLNYNFGFCLWRLLFEPFRIMFDTENACCLLYKIIIPFMFSSVDRCTWKIATNKNCTVSAIHTTV